MIVWLIVIAYAAGWLFTWREIYRRTCSWHDDVYPGIQDGGDQMIFAWLSALAAIVWPFLLVIYPLYRWVTAEPREGSDES